VNESGRQERGRKRERNSEIERERERERESERTTRNRETEIIDKIPHNLFVVVAVVEVTICYHAINESREYEEDVEG